MNLGYELNLIRGIANISQESLAKELHVSFETINRWETGKTEADLRNANALYNFAYINKINLNEIFELYLNDSYGNEYSKVLFHGAKRGLNGEVDLEHSDSFNDFGRGFYMGDAYKHASSFICQKETGAVYAFNLDIHGLKIKTFDISRDWMLAVSWYRNKLKEYKDSKVLKDIVNEVEQSDVIIAPIADNRMLDIINYFAQGFITDEQAVHALCCERLGLQYVIKSQKALNNLTHLQKMIIPSLEKEDLLKERLDINIKSQEEVKKAFNDYYGKGQRIGELLK